MFVHLLFVYFFCFVFKINTSRSKYWIVTKRPYLQLEFFRAFDVTVNEVSKQFSWALRG